MPEQTAFPAGSRMPIREPDTSLNEDTSTVNKLQEAFPEYRGWNAYAFKKQLLEDDDLRENVTRRYFDIALNNDMREAISSDPEMGQEIYSQFATNLHNDLIGSSYVGNTIRETIVGRTASMGVDLNTFPVEEYKSLLEDEKYQNLSPDTLKQRLSKDTELYRQLLEDRFDQFEGELAKQHNSASVLKENPTKLSEAWLTYNKYGSEGLTQYVNLEQFGGVDADDVTGAFRQMQQAQEFFERATIRDDVNQFFTGSPIEDVPYKDIINDKAYQYGVAPSLLASVIRRESSFDPNARGAAGEVGLGQLMKATAEEMGYSQRDLLDPEKNIEATARYLSARMEQFGHDTTLALSAYNWGQGNVMRAIEKYGSNWHTQMPDSTRQYIDDIYEFQQSYGAQVNDHVVHEPIRERDGLTLDIPKDMNRYMAEFYEGRGTGFFRKDDFAVAKSFVERTFPEEFQSPEAIEELRRDGSEARDFSKVAYEVYRNAVHDKDYSMDDLLRTLMVTGEHRQREDGRDEWIIEHDALDLAQQLAFEALSFSSEYNNMINPGDRRGTFSLVPDRREASVEKWEKWKEKLFATETYVEDGEFVTRPASGILATAQNLGALATTGVLDFANRYFLEPVARLTTSAASSMGVDTHNAEAALARWHENTLGASVSDIASIEEDGWIVGGAGNIIPFVQYIGAMIYGGRGILAGAGKAYQFLSQGKKLEDIVRAGAVLKNTKFARAGANIQSGIASKAPWLSGVGVYYTGGAAVEATQPSDVSFYKVIPELVGMSPTNSVTEMYDQASGAGKVGMDILGSLVMDTLFDHAIGAAVYGTARAGRVMGKEQFNSINWNPQKGAYETTDFPQFQTDLQRFWGNLLGPIKELPDGLEYGVTSQMAGRHAATMKGLAKNFSDDASFVMNDVKSEVRKYIDYIDDEFGGGNLLSDAQKTQIVDEQYDVFMDNVTTQMATYFRAVDETGDTALRFADALEGLQPTVREHSHFDLSRMTPSDVTRLRAEGKNVIQLGDRVFEIDEKYWTTEMAERLRHRALRQNVDETVERRLKEEGLFNKENLTDADIRRGEEIRQHVVESVGTPVRTQGRMGYVVDMQDNQYIVRLDDGSYIRQSELTSDVNFERLEMLDRARAFQRRADQMRGREFVDPNQRMLPEANIPESQPTRADFNQRLFRVQELDDQIARTTRQIDQGAEVPGSVDPAGDLRTQLRQLSEERTRLINEMDEMSISGTEFRDNIDRVHGYFDETPPDILVPGSRMDTEMLSSLRRIDDEVTRITAQLSSGETVQGMTPQQLTSRLDELAEARRNVTNRLSADPDFRKHIQSVVDNAGILAGQRDRKSVV